MARCNKPRKPGDNSSSQPICKNPFRQWKPVLGIFPIHLHGITAAEPPGVRRYYLA
jgi:hypothetical protein